MSSLPTGLAQFAHADGLVPGPAVVQCFSMAVNGPQMIGAVLEHLRTEDVELLLANRGLPSVGGKEELSERLQSALQAEICEWEWEAGEVPDFHCGELSVFEEWSACRCCSAAYDTLVTCLPKHGLQLASQALSLLIFLSCCKDLVLRRNGWCWCQHGNT